MAQGKEKLLEKIDSPYRFSICHTYLLLSLPPATISSSLFGDVLTVFVSFV